MVNQKVTLSYALMIIAIVTMTWLFHEFIHWMTGEFLGYRQMMFLNGTAYFKGQNPTEAHKAIVSISAPIATFMQGIIAFMMLRKRGWVKNLYPVLFTAFLMRLLAGIMNFIAPNDEGRVGQYLGIGTHTISLMICGILFYLIFKISKSYGLSWKFQLWTTIIILISSSAIVLIDQFFKFRII